MSTTEDARVDTLLALWQRRTDLLRRRDAVDSELVAIEHRLRDEGAPGMAGRPRKEYTMTRDEAKEAHRRYAAGERSEWIARGEREYGRRRRREQRLRADSRATPGTAIQRQPGLDGKSATTDGPV